MSDSSGFQTNLDKFYSIFVELLVKLTKIWHFHNLLISYWDEQKNWVILNERVPNCQNVKARRQRSTPSKIVRNEWHGLTDRTGWYSASVWTVRYLFCCYFEHVFCIHPGTICYSLVLFCQHLVRFLPVRHDWVQSKQTVCPALWNFEIIVLLLKLLKLT